MAPHDERIVEMGGQANGRIEIVEGFLQTSRHEVHLAAIVPGRRELRIQPDRPGVLLDRSLVSPLRMQRAGGVVMLHGPLLDRELPIGRPTWLSEEGHDDPADDKQERRERNQPK